jgi:hypothetical protein
MTHAKDLLLFLGGTCGNNDWRESFTTALLALGVPASAVFNPVVKDWKQEDFEREEVAKKKASHLLFYLADPRLGHAAVSAYSLVEATMALYDNPKTVVVFDYEGVEGQARKSMNAAESVLRVRFPFQPIFSTSEQAITWLVKDMIGVLPRSSWHIPARTK